MADNLRLNLGAGGSDLKTQDDGSAHWQEVLLAFDPATPTTISKSVPLPVDPQALTSAKTSLATTASLAAAGSTDLDSSQITSSTTGKLIAILITSTVPIKGVLKTVLNAVESSDLAVFFATPGNLQPIKMPSKEFFTQAQDGGAGLDGFRVTITNLDNSQAADVYCTFFWDEV